MKYTLTKNAISSLSIAIEYFKKFYYYYDKYSQSEIDEAIKISITFLENSIELMLKSILVSVEPLSIYLYPDSKVIKEALSKVTDSQKLEDILVSDGNFLTIGYKEVVDKYNKMYHNSSKVYHILNELGEKRNAITHFGIDEEKSFDELMISIINTLDVIYNYLYPQLIKLDDIGELVTSDDLIVDTVHEKKFLFDDEGIYNNIVDFLDEVMETSEEYVCSIRAANPKSKIFEFTEIIKSLIEEKKYIYMLKQHNMQIIFSTCNFKENKFYFDIIRENEELESIYSCYSPYFNVTRFCGETGKIYFLVVHGEHNLYIYNNEDVTWPEYDEAEVDYQWIYDCEKNFCKKYNLSKRNLLLAFENILEIVEQ